MRAFRFIGTLARKFPALLVVCTSLWIVVGIFEALSAVIVAPLIDFLVHGGMDGASPLTLRLTGLLARGGVAPTMTSLLVVFLSFSLVKSLAQIVARYLIIHIQYLVLRDTYLGSYDDFFAARWQFFLGENRGEVLNSFTREINQVGGAFSSMVLLLSGALQLVMFAAVPFYISWKITVVSVAASAVLGLPFVLVLGRIGYRLGRRTTSTANDIMATLHESLAGAKVVLGFGNQDKNRLLLATAIDSHRKAAAASQTIDAGIPILYLPLGFAVMSLALAMGRRWGVPLSEAAVLLYALLRMVPIISQMITSKTALDNYFPSFEQIEKMRARARAVRHVGGNRRFTGFKDSIRFDCVSMEYPERGKALDGVSISIPAGKMIAVVGESGSGKSTMVDILMGLHQPSSGAVLIDGVPLQEFDPGSYRGRIGYVPQDSVLFDMSIRDNLLWSKSDATTAEIEKACRQANADRFIAEMPEGYDTVVGDRGVRLSGGQIQRIALARAILRRPALLILDEATSSLDSHSERLIQEATEAIASEMTIVVVAHRLSTIQNADRIYLLKAGRLVEQGSYADLVAAGGSFARLAKHQTAA